MSDHDGSAAKAQRVRDGAILALTVGLFAWPIFRGLLVNGPKHAFKYLAGDSFYYFAVARNVALTGRFTFDLEHPTNGFHPLWQLWVVVLYKVCSWFSVPDALFPVVVLLSSVCFISVAIYLLGRCFVAAHGRLPVFFLLLPVGVFALTKLSIQPTFGPIWSYADGMESSFVILAYALLLFVMVRPGFLGSASSALVTGVAAAFLCLSRLDHALFTIPLFAGLALQCLARRDKQRFLLAILAGVPIMVAMTTYFAINLYYAGSLVPTSGIVKSTYPDPRWLPLWKDFFSGLQSAEAANGRSFWRTAQILVPMVFAVAGLLRTGLLLMQRKLGSFDFALCVSAVFVLLLGTYNWLYVPLWHQGHWYFPLSVVFVSVLTFHALSQYGVFQWLETRGMWLALVPAVVFVDGYSLEYWGYNHNESYYEFLTEEVAGLKAHYEGQPIKLIEYDDGILCYGTGFPTMSGYLLSSDKETVDHVMKEHKSLLTLAYDRGFDRIATWGYGIPKGLELGTCSSQVQYVMGSTSYLMRDVPRLPDPSPFLFSVDYASPTSGFKVLKLDAVDPAYLEAQELRRAEDWPGVVRALETSLESGAVPEERFFNELGEAYANTGETGKAGAAFRRSLEENEAIVTAHARGGEALNEYLGSIYVNIARAHAGLDEFEEAREAISWCRDLGVSVPSGLLEQVPEEAGR